MIVERGDVIEEGGVASPVEGACHSPLALRLYHRLACLSKRQHGRTDPVGSRAAPDSWALRRWTCLALDCCMPLRPALSFTRT